MVSVWSCCEWWGVRGLVLSLPPLCVILFYSLSPLHCFHFFLDCVCLFLSISIFFVCFRSLFSICISSLLVFRCSSLCVCRFFCVCVILSLSAGVVSTGPCDWCWSHSRYMSVFALSSPSCWRCLLRTVYASLFLAYLFVSVSLWFRFSASRLIPVVCWFYFSFCTWSVSVCVFYFIRKSSSLFLFLSFCLLMMHAL